jgi:hypothetical protein
MKGKEKDLYPYLWGDGEVIRGLYGLMFLRGPTGNTSGESALRPSARCKQYLGLQDVGNPPTVAGADTIPL